MQRFIVMVVLVAAAGAADAAPPVFEPGPPVVVVEGGEVELAPVVRDPDGDELSFLWDVDGDSSFGDSTEPSVTWSAAGSDGPTQRRVRFQVSDGEDTVGGEVLVDVLNAPPVFVDEGPQLVGADEEWWLILLVSDAGPDAVTLEVVGELPPGATFDVSGGMLVWRPADAGLTLDDPPSTWPITVAAEDDDGARTLHVIEVVVGANRPPPAPELLAVEPYVTDPLLSFSRVEDPDEDEVSIFVSVDLDPCFCTPAMRESGPLPQGPSSTEWLSGPLPGGLGDLYFVRWYASDGEADSAVGESNFVLQEYEDDYYEDDYDFDYDDMYCEECGAGCGCRTGAAPATSPGGAFLALAAALAVVIRRRRLR